MYSFSKPKLVGACWKHKEWQLRIWRKKFELREDREKQWKPVEGWFQHLPQRGSCWWVTRRYTEETV
jgi:hypothetical protein